MKGYIFEYQNENEFKKLERSLKKYTIKLVPVATFQDAIFYLYNYK